MWSSLFINVSSSSFLCSTAFWRVLHSAKALCSFLIHSFIFAFKDLISDWRAEIFNKNKLQKLIYNESQLRRRWIELSFFRWATTQLTFKRKRRHLCLESLASMIFHRRGASHCGILKLLPNPSLMLMKTHLHTPAIATYFQCIRTGHKSHCAWKQISRTLSSYSDRVSASRSCSCSISVW